MCFVLAAEQQNRRTNNTDFGSPHDNCAWLYLCDHYDRCFAPTDATNFQLSFIGEPLDAFKSVSSEVRQRFLFVCVHKWTCYAQRPLGDPSLCPVLQQWSVPVRKDFVWGGGEGGAADWFFLYIYFPYKSLEWRHHKHRIVKVVCQLNELCHWFSSRIATFSYVAVSLHVLVHPRVAAS
jgi:hypothetical protein